MAWDGRPLHCPRHRGGAPPHGRAGRNPHWTAHRLSTQPRTGKCSGRLSEEELWDGETHPPFSMKSKWHLPSQETRGIIPPTLPKALSETASSVMKTDRWLAGEAGRGGAREPGRLLTCLSLCCQQPALEAVAPPMRSRSCGHRRKPANWIA